MKNIFSRYEGYNIDLIDEISKILGFNYSVQIVADGSYGSYNAKTDTWNGMIGELLSQKADLAVADLTITYEREQVIKTQLLSEIGTKIKARKKEIEMAFEFKQII
jgi:ionotropic glutamate receptor